MFAVQTTTSFQEWLDGLRDLRSDRNRSAHHAHRSGNLGDVKSVGEGISELRVDVGAGYRVYFVKRGGKLVILLAGGDKSSQVSDIKRAKRLAKEF